MKCQEMMQMKYRKKPVIVEAFQFGVDDIPDWFLLDERVVWGNKEGKTPLFCIIKTSSGLVTGDCGDYVIKGIDEEIYICRDGNSDGSIMPEERDSERD
jgi:hypothetical protein